MFDPRPINAFFLMPAIQIFLYIMCDLYRLWQILGIIFIVFMSFKLNFNDAIITAAEK